MNLSCIAYIIYIAFLFAKSGVIGVAGHGKLACVHYSFCFASILLTIISCRYSPRYPALPHSHSLIPRSTQSQTLNPKSSIGWQPKGARYQLTRANHVPPSNLYCPPCSCSSRENGENIRVKERHPKRQGCPWLFRLVPLHHHGCLCAVHVSCLRPGPPSGRGACIS